MTAIVFDYGGTLGGHMSFKKALEAILEHDHAGAVGESIDRQIAELSGPGQTEQPDWEPIWRAAFAEFQLPFVEELCEAHFQHWLSESPVYEFVPELLHEIRYCGLKTGLLSNITGPSRMIAEDFEAKGLQELFDAVVWSCDLGVRKPAPEAFATIAEKLGEHPSSLFMVGDDEVCDIQPARAAGWRTVRVYSSGHPPETEADLVVRNRDLTTLMLGPREALLRRLSGY